MASPSLVLEVCKQASSSVQPPLATNEPRARASNPPCASPRPRPRPRVRPAPRLARGAALPAETVSPRPRPWKKRWRMGNDGTAMATAVVG